MIDRMAAYIQAYMAPTLERPMGGMELQFNIVSADRLKELKEHPERDVLVRVSGYTAFFADLNPQMQDEIIDRTEYRLFDGCPVEFDLQDDASSAE